MIKFDKEDSHLIPNISFNILDSIIAMRNEVDCNLIMIYPIALKDVQILNWSERNLIKIYSLV